MVSGLVSLYFMANREDGVTEIGEIRQGLEWITMFLWIVVCLLMAHLTPAVGSVRVRLFFVVVFFLFCGAASILALGFCSIRALAILFDTRDFAF